MRNVGRSVHFNLLQFRILKRSLSLIDEQDNNPTAPKNKSNGKLTIIRKHLNVVAGRQVGHSLRANKTYILKNIIF